MPSINDPGAMTGACFDCKHMVELPGNTHIACGHPDTDMAREERLAMVQKVSAGDGKLGGPLEIQGDDHGCRMGWFWWPINFDPTWLVHCKGLTVRHTGAPAGP
jgi:hypothetical protein